MDKTDMKPKDGAIRSGQITQDLTSCVKEVKVRWEAVKGSEPEKGHNRVCKFERSLTAKASYISEPTLLTVNVLNEYLLLNIYLINKSVPLFTPCFPIC